LGHNDYAWEKKEAVSCSNQEALRNENLPIALAETGHHHAECCEERADIHNGAQVTHITQRAGDDTNKKEQATLRGADPGNIGTRGGAQQACFIVLLIDPIAIHNPPCVEKYEECLGEMLDKHLRV